MYYIENVKRYRIFFFFVQRKPEKMYSLRLKYRRKYIKKKTIQNVLLYCYLTPKENSYNYGSTGCK